MAITFYYSPMSSASRVHWALEELGIPYEKVKIDLRAGDQKKPEYAKIHPFQKVPALVDGDEKLFESLAILLHLGETYGVEKGLWPKRGTKEHGTATSWTVWASTELAVNVHNFAINNPASQAHFAHPKEQRSAFVAAHAKESMQKQLGAFDAELGGKSFVTGESFTLADLAIGGVVQFMSMVSDIDLSRYKNVAAWMGRVSSRPALARAMQG